MKTTILYISILFVFFSNLSIAQELEEKQYSKNLVFLEAGGSGGYGSINYEYLFKKINRFKFSARIGLGTYHLTDYTNKFNPDIIIPIAINAYFGNKHNIDISLGETISNIVYANNSSFQPKRKTTFNTSFSVGYRYQKETGGIMLKIAYAPIIENNKMFRNWFALAIGYTF